MLHKKSKLLPGIIFLIALITFNSCKKENTEPPLVKRSFSTVNGFIIDNGSKILATDSGMFILNENTREYELYENEKDIKPFNDLAFTKSTQLELEMLWLASNEGILDIANDKLLNTGNSGLKSNNVQRLDFDYAKRGIFATPDGLSINNNGNWLFSSGQNNLYSNYDITDIASTVNGYTYVTTNGGGVERFQMDVDGISSATIFDTDWTKLESNTVNTVYVDSATQAYGTELGAALHYSEYTKWDWEVFNTSDGLIDNNVISIVKDYNDNWWFGTSNGLSRFDNFEWTSFTQESHNLISNTIKFLAVDTDGSVWIASDNGLSQFINNQWTNYLK